MRYLSPSFHTRKIWLFNKKKQFVGSYLYLQLYTIFFCLIAVKYMLILRNHVIRSCRLQKYSKLKMSLVLKHTVNVVIWGFYCQISYIWWHQFTNYLWNFCLVLYKVRWGCYYVYDNLIGFKLFMCTSNSLTFRSV